MSERKRGYIQHDMVHVYTVCTLYITCTILCSRSLRKVKSIDSFFVLHNMHMILESLESDSKRVFCDTKISSIACWEYIEPESTIHCNGIV